MFNIAEFISKDFIPQEKLAKSERAQIIKEMYAIYTHPAERVLRKKENWKRYIAFLKTIRQADSKKNQSIFKRGKTYLREQPISSFCYFISFIPTKDLYHNKSMMQDCKNRGTSAGGWLMSQIKVDSPRTTKWQPMVSQKSTCA